MRSVFQKSLEPDTLGELSGAKSISILFRLPPSVDWLTVNKTVSRVYQLEFYNDIMVWIHVLCY